MAPDSCEATLDGLDEAATVGATVADVAVAAEVAGARDGSTEDGVRPPADGSDGLVATGVVEVPDSDALGEDTLAPGVDTLTPRVDTLTVGVDTVISGVDTLPAGVDTVTPGADTPTLGTDTPTLGTDTLTPGVDTPTLGVDTLTPDVDRPTLGSDTLTLGTGTLTAAAVVWAPGADVLAVGGLARPSASPHANSGSPMPTSTARTAVGGAVDLRSIIVRQCPVTVQVRCAT